MLKQRILTGLVLAPVALAAVFLLPVKAFSVFIGLVIMLGAWEWANLAGFQHPFSRVAYALVIGGLCLFVYQFSVPETFVLVVGVLWWCAAFVLVKNYPSSTRIYDSSLVRLLMGVCTLIPAWLAMTVLKSHYGASAIMLVLFLVWAADVGAYFSGKRFGKNKLASRVSPKKTIEGVVGGIVLALVVALAFGTVLDLSLTRRLGLMILTVLVVLASVLGDLIESLLKRERGIKDSSNLLPGHGGVMDRIDSLTAALPVFALALVVSGS
ncbi:phosphatidate cytidylyltransferase [Endozoicomonas sp. Mp262]|uniref:phosphatidate cytidylyltransferase n=1 Tax=Endozoicomonas sp. Mp262 TaxID=2919499 RepID=UPI0021D81303